MAAEELTDVRRRQILTWAAAYIAALLASQFPIEPPVREGDPLDQLRNQLDELRRLEGLYGAGRVLVPVTWLADRLGRLLVDTPTVSPLHSPLGQLTVDAALLAYWVAQESGDPREALRWSALAQKAAGVTAAPTRDLIALAAQAHAGTLERDLGARESGLALMDRTARDLDGVTPSTQAYIHSQRGRALARANRPDASRRALDRAMEAAEKATPGEAPPVLSARDARRSVLLHRANALVALDAGEEAYAALAGVLRREPAGRVRAAGAIHLRMAVAAVQADEPVRAAEHILRSHRILTETQSVRRLGTLTVVADDLRLRYPGTEAVRDLDEQLRSDTRYVTTRSMTGRRKVHQRACPTLNRGQISHAEAWPEGNGLEPAEVQSFVATRPAGARPRLEVCQTCIAGR
jgi:hypothetical protein